LTFLKRGQEAKRILKALLPRDPLVRYSEHVAEFGRREFVKAQRAQEEGVIAKRVAGRKALQYGFALVPVD
jgi:hypothetical protein